MTDSLQSRVRTALERSHRLGMIGGDLDEQLAHCASFFRAIEQVAEVGGTDVVAVDLGTGGGVPGVYLATATPDWQWRLVEMRTGRATELERQVMRSGLSAGVDTRPAQVVGHDRALREQVSVVTARAFGPPALVAECAAGLLAIGGSAVVSEPPDQSTEARWPSDALRAWGFDPVEVLEIDGHRFARLRKVAPAPDDVPRLPPRGDRGWLI